MLFNLIKSINVNNNNAYNYEIESSNVKNLDQLNKELKRIKLENLTLKEKIKLLECNEAKNLKDIKDINDDLKGVKKDLNDKPNNVNLNQEKNFLDDILSKCNDLEEKIISETKFMNYLDEVSNEIKGILNKTLKYFLESDIYKSFIIDLESSNFSISLNSSIAKNNQDFFVKFFDTLKLIRTNFLYTFYKSTFTYQNSSIQNSNILVKLKEFLSSNKSENLKEYINTAESIYCVNQIDKAILLEISEELSENKNFNNNLIYRMIAELLYLFEKSKLDDKSNLREGKISSNNLLTSNKEANITKNNLLNVDLMNKSEIKDDLNLELDIDIVTDNNNSNENDYYSNDLNKQKSDELSQNDIIYENQLDSSILKNSNIESQNKVLNNKDIDDKQLDIFKTSQVDKINENEEVTNLKNSIKIVEEYNLKIIEEKDVIIQQLNANIEELTRSIEMNNINKKTNNTVLNNIVYNNITMKDEAYEKLEEKISKLNDEINSLTLKNKYLEEKLINELKLNENVIDKRVIKKQVINLLNPQIDQDIKQDIFENLSYILSFTDEEKSNINYKPNDSKSNLGKISDVFYNSLFED